MNVRNRFPIFRNKVYMNSCSQGALSVDVRRAYEDAQRLAAHRAHFHRHLVVGTTDAARLDLDHRLDVVQRDHEDLQRVLAGLLLDLIERAVDDALGDRLAQLTRIGSLGKQGLERAQRDAACPLAAIEPRRIEIGKCAQRQVAIFTERFEHGRGHRCRLPHQRHLRARNVLRHGHNQEVSARLRR